jgi:hypothetical protein
VGNRRREKYCPQAERHWQKVLLDTWQCSLFVDNTASLLWAGTCQSVATGYGHRRLGCGLPQEQRSFSSPRVPGRSPRPTSLLSTEYRPQFGFRHGRIFISFTTSRPAMVSGMGTRFLSSGVKWTGSAADHSTNSTEVKNAWSSIYISPFFCLVYLVKHQRRIFLNPCNAARAFLISSA